jgi:hypothetical protein
MATRLLKFFLEQGETTDDTKNNENELLRNIKVSKHEHKPNQITMQSSISDDWFVDSKISQTDYTCDSDFNMTIQFSPNKPLFNNTEKIWDENNSLKTLELISKSAPQLLDENDSDTTYWQSIYIPHVDKIQDTYVEFTDSNALFLRESESTEEIREMNESVEFDDAYKLKSKQNCKDNKLSHSDKLDATEKNVSTLDASHFSDYGSKIESGSLKTLNQHSDIKSFNSNERIKNEAIKDNQIENQDDEFFLAVSTRSHTGSCPNLNSRECSSEFKKTWKSLNDVVNSSSSNGSSYKIITNFLVDEAISDAADSELVNYLQRHVDGFLQNFEPIISKSKSNEEISGHKKLVHQRFSKSFDEEFLKQQQEKVDHMNFSVFGFGVDDTVNQNGVEIKLSHDAESRTNSTNDKTRCYGIVFDKLKACELEDTTKRNNYFSDSKDTELESKFFDFKVDSAINEIKKNIENFCDNQVLDTQLVDHSDEIQKTNKVFTTDEIDSNDDSISNGNVINENNKENVYNTNSTISFEANETSGLQNAAEFIKHQEAYDALSETEIQPMQDMNNFSQSEEITIYQLPQIHIMLDNNENKKINYCQYYQINSNENHHELSKNTDSFEHSSSSLDIDKFEFDSKPFSDIFQFSDFDFDEINFIEDEIENNLIIDDFAFEDPIASVKIAYNHPSVNFPKLLQPIEEENLVYDESSSALFQSESSADPSSESSSNLAKFEDLTADLQVQIAYSSEYMSDMRSETFTDMKSEAVEESAIQFNSQYIETALSDEYKSDDLLNNIDSKYESSEIIQNNHIVSIQFGSVNILLTKSMRQLYTANSILFQFLIMNKSQLLSKTKKDQNFSPKIPTVFGWVWVSSSHPKKAIKIQESNPNPKKLGIFGCQCLERQ